jgi:hypothetical protein
MSELTGIPTVHVHKDLRIPFFKTFEKTAQKRILSSSCPTVRLSVHMEKKSLPPVDELQGTSYFKIFRKTPSKKFQHFKY